LYPLFGIRGATYFLGVSEWLFGALLLAGFWNKKAGILGALGLCFSMIATSTIIPFIPGGWAASAGGFPAMTERVASLMKDLVLLGVSVYLLRQDVIRDEKGKNPSTIGEDYHGPECTGTVIASVSNAMVTSGNPGAEDFSGFEPAVSGDRNKAPIALDLKLTPMSASSVAFR
jgi:hypothetical protein